MVSVETSYTITGFVYCICNVHYDVASDGGVDAICSGRHKSFPVSAAKEMCSRRRKEVLVVQNPARRYACTFSRGRSRSRCTVVSCRVRPAGDATSCASFFKFFFLSPLRIAYAGPRATLCILPAVRSRDKEQYVRIYLTARAPSP